MINLVYTSKSNFNLSQPQILDLLQLFRERNHENSITGCLLYYKGMFVQYIEGGQANVLNLFEKIKKDKLHSEVFLLSTSHIYKREFDTWNMAYKNLTGTNHQLAYLKFITSLFKETSSTAINRTPTSKRFWAAVKKSLQS